MDIKVHATFLQLDDRKSPFCVSINFSRRKPCTTLHGIPVVAADTVTQRGFEPWIAASRTLSVFISSFSGTGDSNHCDPASWANLLRLWIRAENVQAKLHPAYSTIGKLILALIDSKLVPLNVITLPVMRRSSPEREDRHGLVNFGISYWLYMQRCSATRSNPAPQCTTPVRCNASVKLGIYISFPSQQQSLKLLFSYKKNPFRCLHNFIWQTQS
jgi:hypothetical protein